MIVTILFWIYSIGLCLPYGWLLWLLIHRAIHKSIGFTPSFGMVWVAGLMALTTLASYATLVFPINLGVHLAVLVGAVVIWYFLMKSDRDLLSGWLNEIKGWNALVWVFVSLAGLIALEVATRIPANPDSGIYHAQAIRWIETYPVVPGLGNLHSRLAFNSSWFVSTALFSLVFLSGRSLHLIASALLLVLLLEGGDALSSMLKRGVRFSESFTILLVPFFFYTMASEVSSPGSDLPVTLISWMLLAQWLKAIEDERPIDQNLASLVLLLSVYAITIKLSAAPLLLAGMGMVVGSGLWRQFKQLTGLAGASILVSLPWFIRNVILSGYLIYPFSTIDIFNVDWKIPLVNAISIQIDVQSWGKLPGEDTHTVAKMTMDQWLPEWWSAQSTFHQVLIVVLIAAMVVLPILILLFRKNSAWTQVGRFWPVYAVVWVGCAFWFFSSPDFRFGNGFLLPALLLTLLPFVFWSIKAMQKWETKLIILMTLLVILFLGVTLVRVVEWRSLGARWLVPADYKSLPTDPCKLMNATVLKPAAISFSECWYSPFPCTPYCEAGVEMRGATWADGFRWAVSP